MGFVIFFFMITALLTLCVFDMQESGSSKTVEKQSSGDAYGYVLSQTKGFDVYIYTWASALLVLDCRASQSL